MKRAVPTSVPVANFAILGDRLDSLPTVEDNMDRLDRFLRMDRLLESSKVQQYCTVLVHREKMQEVQKFCAAFVCSFIPF
jgi:hypothetical protein